MKYANDCKKVGINLASADAQNGINVEKKAGSASQKSNQLENADTAKDINGAMPAKSGGSMDALPVDMSYSYKS